MCDQAVASQDQIDILPKGLTPKHYKLHVYHITRETFKGTVTIDFSVDQATDAIYLNAKDLEIIDATIQANVSKTEVNLNVKSIEVDADTQVAVIRLNETIPGSSSKASVRVNYKGIIQTNMAGFYKSDYKTTKGDDSYMLSTQFEATDARRAFPCMDEPSLKATFDVAMTIKEEWTALSNMPVVSSISKGGETTVVFDTTPVMSTYLLAWACGDFEYIEALTKRQYNGKHIPVRVYTTKGMVQEGQFALDNATKIVDYFSEVFEIDYVLPKVDLLAVHEFSHGAMENWGLITYRTTALLFNEEKSSSEYKKRVAYVVAHELAHQWFGNLVTMDWWNELWLNEGFATWVGWLAIDHFFPEWDVFSVFVNEDLQMALNLDSLRQSHPIEVFVKSALDIDQIFDAISYRKGASTIRMISSHIGVKVFLKGVAMYLKKHAFGNAHTADLWDAVSEVSGQNISVMMDNWITKIGFPMLTIFETESGAIEITQDRFLSTGDVQPEENLTKWWIPLSISTAGKTEDKILDEKSVSIDGLAKDFYKINKDQVGVYRVNYPASRLVKYSEDLSLLTVNDKVGIIADSAAAAMAGIGSTTGLLTFVNKLKNEDSYVVWAQLLDFLASLRSAWFEQPEKVTNGLNKFTADLISPVIARIGLDVKTGEAFLVTQLRTLLFNVAGGVSLPAVVEKSKALFTAYIKGDKSALHPSLKGVVFRVVMANSQGTELEQAYKFIYGELINPVSIDGRETACSALGRAKDTRYIEKAIRLLLSGDVPAMDAHYLGGGLAANALGRWRLWTYIKENWDTIYKLYSTNMVVLDRFIRITTIKFSSIEAFDDITEFFKNKKTHGFERSLGQSLDAIRGNSQWVSRDKESVEAWLKEKNCL
ncbi:hypothetical protein NADFUDRAFT_81746 [Nadsonia fulvescens var. elongata DSM 6958]|uniref:Aminopeptidase n=1 Tax=Nadsonia fulvescens var. elongata DSM 6958 TaxID=857566 RepID=A0A1E3PPM1_9ASCO|nr:hypothetical protein NADFUDRAFT_81746 [Nadsonia fulvescens var. elongata DSM 6958]